MKREYPVLWIKHYGESPFDSDGRLTAIAKNYQTTLEKLDSDLIRLGFENLGYRKNASFPPSASEFVAHCYEFEFDELIGDEILNYINRKPDSEWQWESQLAYNVFKRLQYNPVHNQDIATIIKRANQIHRAIDRNRLDPVPAPMLKMPFKEPSKVDNEKRKFQAKMWFCIMRRDSSIISGEDSPFAWIFKPDVSKQWMAEWYEQGQPEMIDFLRSKEVTI